VNTLTILGIAAGSVVFLILGVLMAVKAFYKVPKADEALVKTGGKEPKVSTGGGLLIVPMFHEVARVSLRAIRIPIDRMGNDAVPSKNMIPAGIRGEMFVQINPQDEEAIVLAVQSLGTCSPSDMGELVRQKIDSQVTDALRTAAFQKTFIELNSEKKQFADDVMGLMQDDLAKLGLTLTAVAVTHVTQEKFTDDAGDVLAAEGRRNVAATVEKNRQETNLITRNAQIAVQEQDVDAREKALALELRRKEKEADQQRQVLEYEAEQKTETEKAVLIQAQAEEEARVAQVRAIAQATAKEAELTEKAAIAQVEAVAVRQAAATAAQKEADETAAIRVAQAEAARKVADEQALQQKLEAEISKNRAVETAKIEKEQAVKVADEQRQQAVEAAEVERQKAIALVRAEEAEARAVQAEAQAKQVTAEEAVTTATEKAVADRQKTVVTIKAEEESEKAKIAADQAAYVVSKKAEGEKDAAVKRAEAVAATAKGDADAVIATANGYAADKKTRAQADFEAAENEAQALIKLAEASLEQGKADAEARKLLVEAENVVASELLLRDVAVKFLEIAPDAIRELMAPVANVAHDVKVIQVNGLGGDGGEGSGFGTPGTILGTGMALSGILPVVREMAAGLVGNDDVQAMAGDLGKVVTAALGSVAKGVAGGPSNGTSQEA
jgi:flotillin